MGMSTEDFYILLNKDMNNANRMLLSSGRENMYIENIFELEKKILKSSSPDDIDKITENMTQQQLRDMIKLLIDRLTPQNVKINRMISENNKRYPDCEHRKEVEVMGVKCKIAY